MSENNVEQFSDNSILDYLKNIWNKYKIIIFVIFAVIIVAFIELAIATNVSDCSFSLERGKINKMNPYCLQLKEGDFVYVLKPNEFNKDSQIFKENIPLGYVSKSINEHIATQISKPVKSIKHTVENFNSSATPINDITSSLIDFTKIRSSINPFNGLSNLSTNWIIFYPKYINPKCFINKMNEKTKIYFT